VRVVREEARLSERRACGLIGMHRGSWRYQAKRTERSRVASSAARVGSRSSTIRLSAVVHFLATGEDRGGTLRWRVNHKRVYRLYREEGLAMQRRRRKRFRAEARVPLVLPTRANEVWTMDYTHDELAGGRKFRTLNLMDGYTREALRIEPDTSLPGLRVVRILDSLRERRGTPTAIQGRQRNGVHQPHRGSVGVSESGGPALHRARQAHAERVDRELQREVSR